MNARHNAEVIATLLIYTLSTRKIIKAKLELKDLVNIFFKER